MSLDAARIQAILFDIDGTLSNTDDQFVIWLTNWMNPGSRIFGKRDITPFARRIVMALEGPGTFLSGLPDRWGWDEKLSTLVEQVSQRLARPSSPGTGPKFILMDGVKEVLLELAGRYPLGIVSARSSRSAQAFLDQFDLQPLFKVVVSAQTCRYTKPYPDPIEWAARVLDLPASACLMVGDTTVDIRAGKVAGAQTVGVLCGFGEAEELQRSGANVILPHTCALADLLIRPQKPIKIGGDS